MRTRSPGGNRRALRVVWGRPILSLGDWKCAQLQRRRPARPTRPGRRGSRKPLPERGRPKRSMINSVVAPLSRLRRHAAVVCLGMTGAIATYGGMLNWMGMPAAYGVGGASTSLRGGWWRSPSSIVWSWGNDLEKQLPEERPWAPVVSGVGSSLRAATRTSLLDRERAPQVTLSTVTTRQCVKSGLPPRTI